MKDLFGLPLRVSRYAGVKRSAEFSECGRYRWWLRRQWPDGNGVVCFVMLNPSTATHEIDDPTIRRCMGFARAWGYRTLSIRNLFAYRSTDPKGLLTVDDPVGMPRNNLELMAACTADRVIAAWGSKVPFDRVANVMEFLADADLHCLGTTKDGSPRHPLYVRNDVTPVRWERL